MLNEKISTMKLKITLSASQGCYTKYNKHKYNGFWGPNIKIELGFHFILLKCIT